MQETIVQISSSQVNEDGQDLTHTPLQVVSYKEALIAYDAYDWARDLASLNTFGMSGGFYIRKGELTAQYAEGNIMSEEDNKVSISLDVFVEKAFLGLFGGKKLSRSFDDISHAEAKNIIHDLYELSADQLVDKYK